MLDSIDKKYFMMALSGVPSKVISDNDISFKCPVCGDSRIHRNEKRLHIYEKNHETRVGCFNGDCAVGQRNVYTFLRDFYPVLFTQYKTEKFKERLDSLSNKSDNSEISDVFAGLSKKTSGTSSTIQNAVECPLKTQNVCKFFEDVKTNQIALDYMKNRGYDYNESDFGKFYYANIDLTIGEKVYPLRNFLVIPLYYNNQIYGFYSRSLDSKQFYTYMNEANLGYKVWNYFNIDKAKPVYITEGIFDAISLYVSGIKNVIACLGAKISDERLAELSEPIFVLDNDKTGKLNALQYLDKGYKTVIYPDIKQKDTNEMLLNKIDLKSLVLKNTFSGILGKVKLFKKL